MWLSALVLIAGLLGPGSRLPDPAFIDQHGQSRGLDQHARFLVISFEKQGAQMTKRWLRSKPESYLADHGVCLLADVSRMPSQIKEKIFLPRLRKYGYPVLLIEDESAESIFPRQPKQLTVIVLDGKGTVVSVQFSDSVEAVETLVEGS